MDCALWKGAYAVCNVELQCGVTMWSVQCEVWSGLWVWIMPLGLNELSDSWKMGTYPCISRKLQLQPLSLSPRTEQSLLAAYKCCFTAATVTLTWIRAASR